MSLAVFAGHRGGLASECLSAMSAEPWGRPPDTATGALHVAVDWTGHAAGFVHCEPAIDEVTSLCVRSDWRGLGIATALVSSLYGTMPDGFAVADESCRRGSRRDSFWLKPPAGAAWAGEAMPGMPEWVAVRWVGQGQD